MTTSPADEKLLKTDLELISKIESIPTILDVICRTTGMGFAAVARVTKDRWIAGSVLDKIGFGLAVGGELEINTTICDEIRDSGKLVAFNNVQDAPLYRDHHTPRIYGLKSYISVPIYRRQNEFFGTLCAIDPNPARVESSEIIDMFRLFAELIGKHIDSQEREMASDMALLLEREVGDLRDQFVAILGHDLRNPLNAIAMSAQILKLKTTQEHLSTITKMENSVQRMASLIDNMLDFSRARLGGGFELNQSLQTNLAADLHQVIDELSIVWSARTIVTEISISAEIYCDSSRICQMLSNLLSNALTHGAREGIVFCTIIGDADQLKITVRNSGLPIAPDVIRRLFQPFSRGSDRTGKNSLGLGLGLYIASQIAKAHHAELTVASDPDYTTFVFYMDNRR
jgi:signal transduction histidine kinase